MDSQGRVVIAGLSGSRDLPGGEIPEGCLPSLGRELPYVARLSADGSRLLASRVAVSLSGEMFPGVRVAVQPDGTPVLTAAQQLQAVDFAAAPGLCATDPTDGTRLTQAAPGQLISLRGTALGETANTDGDGARFPIQLGGVTVSFDGIAAPLVYASPQQVNVQVPFEMVGREVVDVQVVTRTGAVLTRRLRMVPSLASAFLAKDNYTWSTAVGECRGTRLRPFYEALVRNEDGSFNSCENPAAPGSVVTLYVNGLGRVEAQSETGAVNPQPDALTERVSPHVSLQGPENASLVSVEPEPGSISSVWRVRIRLGPHAAPAPVRLLVDGQPLRFAEIGLWVQ